MAYNVNVSDPFVRINDSIVHFEIRLVADGFLEPFPAVGLIVRVKPLKKCLELGWRPSGVKAQNSVALLRPVPDLTGPRVPCPTAGLAQPLRFRQIGFAAL